ncbi:MAG TPA: gluconeogenesis factor YvcK family protein [Armatimonadota bacterium]|jgi:uncharacterized cofD-like protein
MKWLYPGMRVKRWLLLILTSSLLLTLALDIAMGYHFITYYERLGVWIYGATGRHLPVMAPMLALGVILVAFAGLAIGVREMVRSITSVVSPDVAHGALADVVFRRRYLANNDRIVVIGGGTGLSTLLRGLKEHTSNITAIVTVTDDGGSTGRLIREFDIPAPGDIRNCLAALADSEPLMTELFQFRFEEGEGPLVGHSFGNLLLTAMTQITGDFEAAVRETSRVLAIRGRVLPSTLERVTLRGIMVDGSVVMGESAITRAAGCQPIHRIELSPSGVAPLEEAVEAILDADCVVLGPGSVFTSIIPNLLVGGIADALADTRAQRCYVCNVMTQPGETAGFGASDHVRALAEHAGRRIFDHVLVNDRTPHEDILRRYAETNAFCVRPDLEKIQQMGYRVVASDFMSDSNLIRHDPERLTRAILDLL